MILRPMSMADAEKMLEMKNYPETRQFAIASNEEIKRDAHYAWLEKNIQHFQVAEGPYSNIIGAIRIQDNEISIWIDRDHWSNGIATSLLTRVSERGMTAKIVASNIASLRAFIKSGFLPKEFVNDKYYIFEK